MQQHEGGRDTRSKWLGKPPVRGTLTSVKSGQRQAVGPIHVINTCIPDLLVPHNANAMIASVSVRR